MKLHLITFSPTGTSRKIAEGIAKGTTIEDCQMKDFTLSMPETSRIMPQDLSIITVPVYGGHVAPTALKRMDNIRGANSYAIAVVVYGNRHYENALEELCTFLNERDFRVIGAGTFIGEHSYSTPTTPIALGRPDKNDITFAEHFGQQIWKKITGNTTPHVINAKDIELPEQDPDVMMRFKQTVMGWIKQGVQMPGAPKVDETICTNCGTCTNICPTSAISLSNPSVSDENLCIKCCACVKGCPLGARSLQTSFAKLLTENFDKRKENMTLL